MPKRPKAPGTGKNRKNRARQQQRDPQAFNKQESSVSTPAPATKPAETKVADIKGSTPVKKASAKTPPKPARKSNPARKAKIQQVVVIAIVLIAVLSLVVTMMIAGQGIPANPDPSLSVSDLGHITSSVETSGLLGD